MKRILHIAPGMDYGGIASFILNYYSHFPVGSVQMDVLGVFSADAPRREQLEKLGGRYSYVGTFSNVHLLRNIIAWTRFIRQGQYDVVHSHCNLVGAWMMLAAWIAGVPIRVTHSHSTGLLSGSFIQRCYVGLRRWMIKCLSTHRLACSHDAGIVMYGKNLSFDVLNNGIEVEEFIDSETIDLSDLRQELSIPVGHRVYTLVARISEVKNHDFAVDIFRWIHQMDPSAILLIGGAGGENDPTERHSPTGPAMHRKIHDYGLESHVRIVGPRKDMKAIYALTDCWLFPSLYEGFSIALLELQASSIPTIVSDRVSQDSDIGLNLLTFVSLDESPQVWAQLACATHKSMLGHETILSAFKKRSLDVESNVSQLAHIYGI